MESFVQKEKWSKNSILTTVLCFAVLGGFAWYLCAKSWDEGGGRFAVGMFVVIAVVISVMALFYMPLWLSVDDYGLCISFSARKKVLALEDIESVELCTSATGFVRTFGCGGVFGYWGWHYSRELGKFMLYASAERDLIFIRMKNGRKYVVSSPDPKRMIEEIKKRK